MSTSTRRPKFAARIAALVAVSALGLSACGGSSQEATATSTASSAASSAASSEASMTSSGSADAMHADMGSYLTLEKYQNEMAQHSGTKVVYFFHAPWCPDCRATDASLTKDGVPAGITVVKVDFDTQTELRQKYGITQQHTFVQVGKDGSAVTKWSGSQTGADIKTHTM